MKIIISPAKKMKIDPYTWAACTQPYFIDDSMKIIDKLKKLGFEELKELYSCSDSITAKSIKMLMEHSFISPLTPAILSYDGIAFTHMAPNVFNESMFSYVDENLIILSALYGALKPFDGVMPYRLEMQAKLAIEGKRNLYEFWGDRIYKYIKPDDGVIINLASKEYSDVIPPYISSDDRLIDIVFLEEHNSKLVTKATFAKMARGEMVRFMAQNKVSTIEEIKSFNVLGFFYREDLSNDKKLVFERKK